jgi:LPS O-antigen subunit length determinant protein (WzzB/FepE family)
MIEAVAEGKDVKMEKEEDKIKRREERLEEERKRRMPRMKKS